MPRPFWRRWLMWPALGLMVLNLGTLVAYTLPRRLQERTIVERARTLREEVERERKVNEGLRLQAQAVGANLRDMKRFLKQVVAGREGLSVVLEELEHTAQEQGLQPGRRAYHRNELDRLPLVRFEVTLPLSGSYKQLMGFLDALERSPRFVIVDKVSYKDKDGGAPDLDVTLSAYFARDVERGD
jgi:Tfp pilus assembly protein PilO